MGKYIITMTTKSNGGVYGKNVHKTTTEKIDGLTKKGREKYLKEILDVAIKVDGKAYRPTIADIKNNFKYLTVAITEDEIKNVTSRYQNAYDVYIDILQSVNRLDYGETYKKFFAPFNMDISIEKLPSWQTESYLI